jgi:hypothetical protein
MLVALCGLISLTVARPAAAQLFGLSFDTSTIDDPPQGIAGTVSAIAVDHHNFPHIVYVESIGGSLRYAYADNAGWHRETILGPGSVSLGAGISLALDAADYPHISYYTHKDYTTNGDVRYGRRDCDWFNGRKFCWWHHETIASQVYSPFGSGNTSIALNKTGLPQVAYFDHAALQLVWAQKAQSGPWSTTNLVSVKGGSVTLALDASTSPQIVYSDAGTGIIHHGRVVCFFILCGFNFTTVDSGMAGTLRLTQADQPRLSYWQSGQIKYAEGICNGTTPCTWSTVVIDTVGNASYHPTLALTASGTPSIAYLRPRGAYLADLIYATPGWRFLGWTKEYAYRASDAIADVSLALDSNNYPHISHQIQATAALGYSRGGPLENAPPNLPPISGLAAPDVGAVDDGIDDAAVE